VRVVDDYAMQCDGDAEVAEKMMMAEGTQTRAESSYGHCSRRREQEEPFELLLDLDFDLDFNIGLDTIDNAPLHSLLDLCSGRKAHDGVCFNVVVGP